MNKFSPEARLIYKDSNQQEIQAKRNESEEHKKNLEIAHKKAVELLDGERIDPEEFRGLYGDDVLKKHSDYVDTRQKKFKENDDPDQSESRKYAVVFEAIIHNQIDMNGWLGEHATAQKASWYDDLKNGIDEIIEFDQTETAPAAHLALGIDVTFGKGIVDKMDNIKSRIDKGDIGVIKYLLTDTYRGEMKNVPRVLVGADMKNLNEIIKLWVDNKKRSLAQHRVKFMILNEMMVQLNDFGEYAEKQNQPVIANGFNKVLKIVENIWDEELRNYPNKDGEFNFEDDRVYSAIRNYCDDLNK